MLKNFINKNQTLAVFDAEGTALHWMSLFLRITLAIVFFPHGAQMLFGWFGGGGFTATMSYMTENAGLPWIAGLTVILLQSLGSIALALGIFSRFLALSFIFVLIGMIVTSHLDHGFFMNWYGTQAGEGYEFHLLALGMSMALVVGGGGKYALSRNNLLS